MQSYCAQGSDYYTLEAASTVWVLSFPQGIPANIKRYENKKVVVRGDIVRKTIISSTNPMEQRPVNTLPDGSSSSEMSCEVLEVQELKRN